MIKVEKLTNYVKKINYQHLRKKIFGNVTTDGLVFKIFVYLLLIGISYVFVYPFIRMILLSFMSQKDVLDNEVYWIPSKFTLESLRRACEVLGLPRNFKEWFNFKKVFKSSLMNSIKISTLYGLIQTLVAALTGFAFARFKFKLKNFWFAMVIFSFIVPLPVVMVPRIMMFETIQMKVKVLGTIYPQLFLTLFGQGVNNAILILIFYNFFKMIPHSLDEAARIDGANSLQVFWHIFIRMSLSIIVTVFLFAFVWNWNESYMTSTFLRYKIPLLPMNLSIFDSTFSNLYGGSNSAEQIRINESYKMAGTLITMLPLIILYIFAQRQFIEGIERTGITGE
ncbi:MAG: carbohydrate ABC transporter permease [Bacilli bacterium]|nr:carbohydrate ABC transporter permease [Bacilli bacterium]